MWVRYKQTAYNQLKVDFRILKGFNVNNRGCNPWCLYKIIRTPNGVQYQTFIYWTPFGVRIHVLFFPRVSPMAIHIQVLRTCKIVQCLSQILNTIWLKPIYSPPSARPINGTAIDTKNTTLHLSCYLSVLCLWES